MDRVCQMAVGAFLVSIVAALGCGEPGNAGAEPDALNARLKEINQRLGTAEQQIHSLAEATESLGDLERRVVACEARSPTRAGPPQVVAFGSGTSVGGPASGAGPAPAGLERASSVDTAAVRAELEAELARVRLQYPDPRSPEQREAIQTVWAKYGPLFFATKSAGGH